MMASLKNYKGSKYVAKLADKQAPCAFCQRNVDDETTYGKLYSIGAIYCHYFCALLSCCLIQNGKDEDGLFGFLYSDILAEIERSKKHKCSYCSHEGAAIGCSVSQCRTQFHLPCGREKHAVSLFYGNYKTFCKKHAPKQKIPVSIMVKAKQRQNVKKMQNFNEIKEFNCDDDNQDELQSICVICYEPVDGFPTTQTFWPPCCARDAWFHRGCLERMALSAGVHYLKCPLCNDKTNFYQAVLSQGYYIPDRDAAWELEQNAFADIYEKTVLCAVEVCECPEGREHDADTGPWAVLACPLCGGGAHAACGGGAPCAACRPAAPAPGALAALARIPLPTQNSNTQRRQARPVMPSRMSLRRTKARQLQLSSSQNIEIKTENNANDITVISRQELNLKSPKKAISRPPVFHSMGNKLMSPLKLLERDLYEKLFSSDRFELDQSVLNEVQAMYRRPKPLVEKRRIVNKILLRFVNNMSAEGKKTNEPRKWISPKKIQDEEKIIKNDEMVMDIDVNAIEEINNQVEEKLSSLNLEVVNELFMNKNVTNEDDSSSSTFQLPPEFLADYNSDQSLPIFDTPKKLKKINIDKDSMEISKNDRVINIDLVKTDTDDGLKDILVTERSEICALKFSSFDKEVLERNNLDIDVESFKNQYLNEVDRQFNNNSDYKQIEDIDLEKNSCTVDVKVNPTKKPPKRKLPSKNCVATKRRKTTKIVENVESVKKKQKKKRKVRNKRDNKNELSIRNKNIKLKIKWKDEELKLKITKPKRRKTKKDNPKVLKQYVLKYYNNKEDGVIGRPDVDVGPIKRKRLKTEKPIKTDIFKQTSIDRFFKNKPVICI